MRQLMALSGRSLAIDPFSYPDTMVVHYLVNKNDIIKLAEEINSNSNNNAAGGGITKTNTTGMMKFALYPLSATTAPGEVSTPVGVTRTL